MRILTILMAATTLSSAAIAADVPRDGNPARFDPAAMQARRQQRQTERAGDIALLLGLRGDQRPALDAYLGSLRPHWDRAGAGRDHKRGGPDGAGAAAANGGTMARLDAMAQRIDGREAMAKGRIEATRRFYASLTPDQQQRFDALARLRHGGMHRGGGWRGHGGMERSMRGE